MKVISDIRLYKSEEVDKYGEFENRLLNIKLHRVVMKLREQGFSLGEFDHLYMNFTTTIPNGKVELSDKIDRYHPWFRYCNVGVSQSDYNKLENDAFVYERIKFALLKLVDSQNNIDIIEHSFAEAQKGSEMLMLFKVKRSAKGVAKIYLRLLDNGNYLPLLSVADNNGKEIIKAELPETTDLNIIGELNLSSKNVTVKPRKNTFSKHLQPISFDIKL